MLYKNDIKNKKIILLQGENGRQLIQKELRKKNIDVSVIECYKRFFKKLDGIKEGKKWRSYEINSLLVTSSEIIYKLNTLFSDDDRQKWLFKCKILVIGERLAYLARNIGWTNIMSCQYANNKYLLNFIDKIRNFK
ncbi:uroporphyrinogen-III synthase [Buchnera aphidicola]|uniref:uroporphyrinogen-III synthase n=1 Tax=Buchnera aphidicola TaxID=9 RepID=UPI003463FAD0